MDWPYPRVAAHRGAGRLAPENTLAALRAGAALGCTMFEFDVKLSRDAVPVLMHDETVERTTDGHGRVAELAFDQLARLDAGGWHSARYAGEPVPALAAVARWLIRNAAMADIEIKPCPGREAATGEVVALEARRLWVGESVRPLLSSFSAAALERACAVAPEFPRLQLFESLPPDWAARCAALGCIAVGVWHAALSERAITQAHHCGLRVLAYTVDDPARADELFGWGLDTLVTDAVDRIAP